MPSTAGSHSGTVTVSISDPSRPQPPELDGSDGGLLTSSTMASTTSTSYASSTGSLPFLSYLKMSHDPVAQAFLERLALFWALTVCSFAILSMSSPLVLREVVGMEAAATWQGRLVSVTAFFGLIFCVGLGHASDRVGRTPLLKYWSYAFLLGALSLLASDVFTELWGVIASRMVPISVGSTLVYALAADVGLNTGEVLKAHAVLGATFSASMLAGHAVAAVLAMTTSREVLLTAAVAFAVLASVVARRMAQRATVALHHHGPSTVKATERMRDPETNPLLAGGMGAATTGSAMPGTTAVGSSMSRRGGAADGGVAGSAGPSSAAAAAAPPSTSSFSLASLFDPAPLRLLRRDHLLRNVLWAFCLLRMANVNSFAFFVLFATARFHWTLIDLSIYLCVLGASGALVQIAALRVLNANPRAPVNMLFLVAAFLTPLVAIMHGAVSTTPLMYLTGICSSALTILPALFASKIASLSKDEGFTGFSLGLVGTLQNLGETFLGVAMGELLSYSLRTYSPNSWSFGLPYFVNSLFYLSVALVLCYAHYRYGVHRDIWVSQGVTFGTSASASPAPPNDEVTTSAAAVEDGDAHETGAARTIATAPTLKVVA